MQVLSDGRIRRTESEWRVLVKRFEASDQSEAAFCRTAKLSRRSFREWRKRLKATDGTPRRLRAPEGADVPRRGILVRSLHIGGGEKAA